MFKVLGRQAHRTPVSHGAGRPEVRRGARPSRVSIRSAPGTVSPFLAKISERETGRWRGNPGYLRSGSPAGGAAMSAQHHGRQGRPWRRMRIQILRRDPCCTIRGPKCTGISTTVDHVIPLSTRPDLAHDPANLRGACGPCNFAGGARISDQTRHRRPAQVDRRPAAPRRCSWVTTLQPCTPACDGLPLSRGCGRSTTLKW